MRPYELPKEFAGFVIARLLCPVCEKEFTTAISLKNFFTKNPSGSFHHYEEDGGCGITFNIIGAIVRESERWIIAETYARGKYKERKKYAFYIGGPQEVYTTDNLYELE